MTICGLMIFYQIDMTKYKDKERVVFMMILDDIEKMTDGMNDNNMSLTLWPPNQFWSGDFFEDEN